jgi:hypothetical protein
MIYKLRSENLSGLGQMGSSSSTNWEKYFSKVSLAKKFAEKDYRREIKWKKSGNRHTSGDLRYVMYDIEPVKVVEK